MSCECITGGQGIDFHIRTTKNGSKECEVDGNNSKYEVTVENLRPQDIDYAIWSESEKNKVEFNDNGVCLSVCTQSDTVDEIDPSGAGVQNHVVDVEPYHSSNTTEDIDIEVRFSDVFQSVNTKTESSSDNISVKIP